VKLSDVTSHDAAWSKEFPADADRFFDAETAYRRTLERQIGVSADVKTALTKAEAELKSARSSLKRPEFQKRLDQLLTEHERQANAVVEEAERRAAILGKSATDWSTTDLDGKRHTLADYRGKVVILDFWYRTCFWCVRAMPQMKEIATLYKDKPVVILGMNTDPDEADARFVAEKMGLNYATLKAAGVPEKYKVQAFPTLIVIDQSGIVRDMHIGYTPTLKDEVVKSVERLLNAKP
jgi:peroxiredoxin